MVILCALLLLSGSICLYLTSTHQRWLTSPAHRVWRYTGYALWLLALAGLITRLSLASALFCWVALIMTTLPAAALSGLLRKES